MRCFFENSSEDFLGENLKIDFTLHADYKSVCSVWHSLSKSEVETSQDFTQTSHVKGVNSVYKAFL